MKYVDITAIIQVIGSIYQNSSLLDNENYFFNEDDFTEDNHYRGQSSYTIKIETK